MPAKKDFFVRVEPLFHLIGMFYRHVAATNETDTQKNGPPARLYGKIAVSSPQKASMSSNYKVYLFDFDYTLADSSCGIILCFRKVLSLQGYTGVTDEAIRRTIGKTLEESFSILTGVTETERLADFKRQYVRAADNLMTVNTRLFPETCRVLDALKAQGARVGIISTKFRYRIRELLDMHLPFDFMDVIIGGEDVSQAKPSPEGLLLAIERLGAKKEEVLYIGDSTVDAETARAAGVDFAGITHGVTTAEELAAYPHRQIMATLDELLPTPAEPPATNRVRRFLSRQPRRRPSPSPSAPIQPKERKLISWWQCLLLLFLCFLSYHEIRDEMDSFVFPTLFLLSAWGILRKRRLLTKRLHRLIDPYLVPLQERWSEQLRLLKLRQNLGRRTPPLANEPCICRNCGHSYTGNFCNRCGQSHDTPRYRLSNALRNIAGGFTNIDSGFGRSLTDLLYRPGYMIRDFIGGKRIHYFRPFQMLFVLTALYIMAVQLVDPLALEKKKEERKLLGDSTEEIFQETRLELLNTRKTFLSRQQKADTEEERLLYTDLIKQIDQQLEAVQKQIDADSISVTATSSPTKAEDEDELILQEFMRKSTHLRERWKHFVEAHPFIEKVWNLLVSWAHGNKAFRIIATLPLFALATQMAFRRKRFALNNYNLTEHVFIQAYIACQIVILSILALPLTGKATVNDLYDLPLWFIFFLYCWDYHQLYHCTWWRSFWRTLLMCCYAVLLIILISIVIVGLFIAMVYLGNLLL